MDFLLFYFTFLSDFSVAFIFIQIDLDCEVTKDDIKIGNIKLNFVPRFCKNYYDILDRYYQEYEGSVYIISRDNQLHQILWSNIHSAIYYSDVIADNVYDFVVTKSDLNILQTDGMLKLARGRCIGLEKIDAKAKWTILIRSTKWWIVSGDLDGQAIIACISQHAIYKSKICIKMTSNGYTVVTHMSHPNMHTLKSIDHKHNMAVILAFERDGCYHMMYVNRYARLVIIKSYGTLVPVNCTPDNDRIILCVSHTHKRDEIFVSGMDWCKKITLGLR